MSESQNDAQSSVNDRAKVEPDTTKRQSNSSTQALADFLQVVGSGVADLNTIAVGLAAISQNHVKPDGLNISWAPKDPQLAAKKARKAAVHAAMVVTVEALNQYVRAVTKLPRFERLTSEWKSRKPKPPSAAERFSELAKQLFTPTALGSEAADYDTRFRSCCVMLLIHWRNRHVHTDSSAELTHQEKQLVQANEERIRDAYAGLGVEKLFCDFEQNRPTLKEVTTLIAMTIQEVREMDQAVYVCNDAAELQAWLAHYKLTGRIEKIQRESSPEKRHASVLRMLNTHAPRLTPWYEKFIPDTVIVTP
ncbi:hypothetical protein [Pseudomonas sp. DP16D-R1]|uniref:hypothetical protein n=1 Tax=Pseudomonas sp. DP16D-R1 TaxID=2075551 RepID=UPI000CD2088B|nr:hypothetical protein [Pseudomonas sp. DP16D-R1]POA70810.1 hypothetical protein C1890_31330 [Pseudomonas sp. DP16D-R1]